MRDATNHVGLALQRNPKSRSDVAPPAPLALHLGTVLGFAAWADLVRPIGGQPLARCGRWPSLGGLPLDSFRYKSAAGSPGRGGAGAPDWPRWPRGTFNDVAAQSSGGTKSVSRPGRGNLIHWGQAEIHMQSVGGQSRQVEGGFCGG